MPNAMPKRTPSKPSKQPQPLEPHEIAGSMTPAQIKVFAAELAKLMAKK
jgi:hypothetical protein